MFETKRTKFAKMFINGGLKIPEKMLKRDAFRAAKTFSAPKKLDLSGYCTPVENQGNLPYCAAYSASSFAENILWRKNHFHEDIDPVPLYKYAKTIDGDPKGAGTYLECTLEALLHYKYFDPIACKIKTFGGKPYGSNTGIDDMKFAIHRYGICMAGFAITSEWFSPRGNIIRGSSSAASQGGHAVVVCGYDDADGGVFKIMNSWGNMYAENGFVYITYKEFEKEFIYAGLMTHVLDD